MGKALDWAGHPTEPTAGVKQRDAAHLMPGYGVAQVGAVICTAAQRAISDRLRMTKPELAGQGLGVQLWRLLVREREAPGGPCIQR